MRSERSRSLRVMAAPFHAATARLAARIAACGLVLTTLTCGGKSPEAAAVGPVFPQVEDNGGGILTAPKIVTVTFDPSLYTNATDPSAETLLTDLQTFDDVLTTTSWWSIVTKDYCDTSERKQGCIEAGSAGAHVAITTAPVGDGTASCGPQPCYTDSSQGGTASLQTYLSGLFTAGTLPAPDAQTLYVVYLPKSVTINLDGALSCNVFGGYHGSLNVGNLNVPYAIVPLCDPEQTATGVVELTVEQTATLAASHEIVEATTDPHAAELLPGEDPNSTENLGWYLTDEASQAWALPAGGEIADLCVDILGLGQDRWSEGGYTVQRVWSNSSAAQRQDPCVPIPAGEVYFNAGPSTVQSDQLSLAVGAPGSLQIDAFADGTAPAWQVFALDIGTDANGNPLDILDLTPSEKAPATVTSGSSIALDVTLTSDPPPKRAARSATSRISSSRSRRMAPPTSGRPSSSWGSEPRGHPFTPPAVSPATSCRCAT